MKIFTNAFAAGREFPNAVVALGKFDALHRGHMRVLRSCLRKARALKTPFVIVTFDPAPELYRRLYSYRPVLPLARRLKIFRAVGAGAVVLLPFDKRLACLTPEAFAKNVLALQLRPLGVCVGTDFCFGRDRAGRVATLRDLGRELGFSVYPVRLLKDDGEKISAPRIRAYLDAGDVAAAERLLGRALDDAP